MARKRMRFFHFLETDAPDWTAEQDYHRGRLADHQLEQLGSGILAGLEVLPNAPVDLNVVVNPGRAIDGAGYMWELPGSMQLSLATLVPPSGNQIAYIVGRYAEQATDPEFVDELGQSENTRWMDSAEVQAQIETPMPPWIELARVNLATGATAITAAADPDNPQVNEIDLRYAIGTGGRFRARDVTLLADGAGVSSTAEQAIPASRWGWEPTRYPARPRVELEVVAQVGAAGETGEVRLYDETNGTLLLAVQVASPTPARVRSAASLRLPAAAVDLGIRVATTSGASPTTVYTARLILN